MRIGSFFSTNLTLTKSYKNVQPSSHIKQNNKYIRTFNSATYCKKQNIIAKMRQQARKKGV